MANTGALEAALNALAPLESQLKAYQPFYAARAELYARAGQITAARADYIHALSLTSAKDEKLLLRHKLENIE